MENLYGRTQILKFRRSDSAVTHDQLRPKLVRHSIRVTRATVSHDTEELSLLRTRSGYRQPSTAEPPAAVQPTFGIILKKFWREENAAANLVVLKTHRGNSQLIVKSS